MHGHNVFSVTSHSQLTRQEKPSEYHATQQGNKAKSFVALGYIVGQPFVAIILLASIPIEWWYTILLPCKPLLLQEAPNRHNGDIDHVLLVDVVLNFVEV